MLGDEFIDSWLESTFMFVVGISEMLEIWLHDLESVDEIHFGDSLGIG